MPTEVCPKFTFIGREWDRETHLRNRYYPILGRALYRRFSQADFVVPQKERMNPFNPVDLLPSLNSYLSSNPSFFSLDSRRGISFVERPVPHSCPACRHSSIMAGIASMLFLPSGVL